MKPWLKYTAFVISALFFIGSNGQPAEPVSARAYTRQVSVEQMWPDQRGGKAYKLTYQVQLPIDTYWKFKTDFRNEFLLTNKYIHKHRLISDNGDTAITEDKYSNAPDVFFVWETKIISDSYRLEFALLNPEHCGQRFNYGYIQLELSPEGTRVTQVGYFDFLGASLWSGYPWGGGMVDFLTYTAHWEQDLVLGLKDRYSQ